MGDFNPQELIIAAWAFAKAGQNDALLVAALTTGAVMLEIYKYLNHDNYLNEVSNNNSNKKEELKDFFQNLSVRLHGFLILLSIKFSS